MNRRYTRLLEEERNFLMRKRKNKNTEKNEFIRCSAILMSENQTMQDIAKFFDVTVRTVVNWLNLWEKSKKTDKNISKGRPNLINSSEEKLFIYGICTFHNAKILSQMFNQQFEKSISVDTMIRFLKKNSAIKESKNLSKK